MALRFYLGPLPTLGKPRLSDPIADPNCRRWVKRPDKWDFIRTHARIKITTALLSVKMQGQGEITALVKNDEPRAALHQHISMVCLRPTMPQVGQVFLWPIKLPVGNSRGNAWNESAVRAA